ncbi:MAG: 8-oxo-dGTP diphosphatase MutT [Gammaproteobacteria bacterium]|nr:MAG: 8-oxo-dGTP diphosphatase MutT [Gammaproteobacteria bacterium]
MAGSSSGEILVAAAVIRDASGRVLIARRPPGRPLAGSWEFPGGKIAAGETPREALARELREEIGIEVRAAAPFIRYRHDYPGRAVVLDVWTVAEYTGEPRALEGQALRWESVDRLMAAGLLEADRPIVEALLLGGAQA